MALVDLQELAREVNVDWREPPRLDQNEDYAELEGAVVTTPSAESLESAMRTLGLEVRSIPRRAVGAQAPVVEILGRREREELRIFAVPAVPPPYAASATLHLTWKSGRRPTITGATYAWNERLWPVVLDDAYVYHRSSRMLILEGHAQADCVPRLAAWAKENAMRPVAPYEPDLGGALHVSDAKFAMTLTPRGEWTTLTIAWVEDGA